MAEKTHAPTPKRLRDARAKGDVPRAPLVAGAVGLLALVVLVPAAMRALLRRLAATMNDLRPIDRVDPWSLGGEMLAVVTPIAAALIAVAVVSSLATGGLVFSPSKLAPDPSRLDPFGGLKNLFDKTRIWGALRGFVVVVACAWLLGGAIFAAMKIGARATGDVSFSIVLASTTATKIATTAAIVALAVAVVDAIVARRMWLSRLKMTREEVMREHREGEGDPEIKRRREELHHELLAGEAIRAVRDATVLVVNPTHVACALRYTGEGGEEEAPTLLAKGQGAIAARMIEAARAWGVPIVRDEPVARALHDLEVGAEIPEVLYEAVAEILRAAWEQPKE